MSDIYTTPCSGFFSGYQSYPDEIVSHKTASISLFTSMQILVFAVSVAGQYALAQRIKAVTCISSVALALIPILTNSEYKTLCKNVQLISGITALVSNVALCVLSEPMYGFFCLAGLAMKGYELYKKEQLNI